MSSISYNCTTRRHFILLTCATHRTRNTQLMEDCSLHNIHNICRGEVVLRTNRRPGHFSTIYLGGGLHDNYEPRVRGLVTDEKMQSSSISVQSSLHNFIFFVLFLLYHFSCKLKIGNRIVKDPDEVAEDCMTLY